MDPANRTYTVAMPWYERADFYELWALSADDHDVPRDYERWHSEACRVMHEHLAAGRAIQFIRIKPAEYLQWLGGAPNTAAMRLTYVETLASGIGAQLPTRLPSPHREDA